MANNAPASVTNQASVAGGGVAALVTASSPGASVTDTTIVLGAPCTPGSQTLTSSGAWTVPANCTQATLEAWGAGGGGGNADANSGGGGGGGGGAYSRTSITTSNGQSYSVTVGIGGAAASSGGDSYVQLSGADRIRASGGSGGQSGTDAPTGGSGGAGGSANGSYPGGSGGSGSGTLIGVAGGGGGGSEGENGSNGGSAGNASFNQCGSDWGSGNGGAGGCVYTQENGFGGSQPGGGGGGAGGNDITSAGGSGGNGMVRISWSGAPPQPVWSITESDNGNFALGQSGATYTIQVSNLGGAASTNGTSVTVAATLSAGQTATATGNAWNCTNLSCSRTDALASGATYPPITLTVSVASNAPATVSSTATVIVSNVAQATASDTATIHVAPPTFSPAAGNYPTPQNVKLKAAARIGCPRFMNDFLNEPQR